MWMSSWLCLVGRCRGSRSDFNLKVTNFQQLRKFPSNSTRELLFFFSSWAKCSVCVPFITLEKSFRIGLKIGSVVWWVSRAAAASAWSSQTVCLGVPLGSNHNKKKRALDKNKAKSNPRKKYTKPNERCWFRRPKQIKKSFASKTKRFVLLSWCYWMR